MRKFYDWGHTLAMWVLFAGIGLSVVCCSKDDDDDPELNINNTDIGKNNTTDMAVTGGVSKLTSEFVTVIGYININQTTAAAIEEFGVEYSTNSSFTTFYGETHRFVKVPGYTGREFSVGLDVLPNTTYYYRTYIQMVSGMYYYGQTLTFTTPNIDIQFTVSDISYTHATINSPEGHSGLGRQYYQNSTLYYSKSADGPFNTLEIEFTEDYDSNYNSINQYTIYDLEPGTTYYCYLVSSHYGYKSNTFSFTTKKMPVDLSDVSVKCSYAPAYSSYKDWRGQTVDIRWLGGTYTVNITSDLGNQYKYGIMLLNGSEEEYYSTSTSSPYTVKVDYWAADFWSMGRIRVFLELIESGEIVDAELRELEAELEGVKRDVVFFYPIISAFVEIDGERFIVGSIYNMGY